MKCSFSKCKIFSLNTKLFNYHEIFFYEPINYNTRMVLITKGAIHAFAKKHGNAIIPLNEWHEKTKKAQ